MMCSITFMANQHYIHQTIRCGCIYYIFIGYFIWPKSFHFCPWRYAKLPERGFNKLICSFTFCSSIRVIYVVIWRSSFTCRKYFFKYFRIRFVNK